MDSWHNSEEVSLFWLGKMQPSPLLGAGAGGTHWPHSSLSNTARWRRASPFAACLGGYLWAHIFPFFPGRFEEMDGE